MTSCVDPFVSLIAACRELGLTSADDATVRRPHHGVDEFRFSNFVDDARRLTALAGDIAHAIGMSSVLDDQSPADWSGRSGRAAGGVLRSVGAGLADLSRNLNDGAAATAQAAIVLDGILGRHRGVLDLVSTPRLSGFDLDALPAALNSGTLSPHALRGEIQARLEYAETAGVTASDSIREVLTEVATAWAAQVGSDGELALADMQ
ncbi:hypothetical protein [Gordonia sp. (in: high G+C Gram-positive bacteria)]|uniref:hypothetical protein n=1 Tax=Gordonia sp. (in: high G+C Gram-positive bacteria) TaxID=84139 RepID=UPI003C7461FB